MPGTQPAQAVALEDSNRCFNCHDGYNAQVDIGTHWRGSMMSQAARDPLFFASYAVALQDSIWALGNANAGDSASAATRRRAGWEAGRTRRTARR